MAESKRYYWLKLKRDFLKRHDIRIIKKLPHGKECVLFYLELMLESIDHEGQLRFSEEIPYDYEMLAAVTDTELEIVELAFDYLIKFKMVKFDEDKTIILPGVQQLIGSAVDNDNAKRQQRFRDKKKETTLRKVTDSVTKNNESKRKRIDKDKDLELERREKEINKEKEKNCKQVLDNYATLCPSLPPLNVLSDSIKADILESIEKYGLEKINLLFEKAEASSFLKGNNKRNWVATFDWLINADNIAKVLNGNFDSKKTVSGRTQLEREAIERLINSDNEEPKTTELSPEYIARVEALKKDLKKG